MLQPVSNRCCKVVMAAALMLLSQSALFSHSAHAAGVYTIEFEYHPAHLNNPGTADNASDVSHAVTRHYDGFRDPSDTVDTVLFVDGLKRVVQTKKDQHVGGTDVMVVSGRVIFDHAGRVIRQHYPNVEVKGNDRFFNSTFDPVTPTRYTYDVQDRQTRIQIPDSSYTSMYYGFGRDRNGQIQFETRVVDAERKEKRTYKDVRNLITSVTEFNAGAAIQTSYTYDALKQIVRVTDARNNLTRISYDNLGRRTLIDNPDMGKTVTTYDSAGNVTAKETSNLRNTGKLVRYDYDYNRLSTITYPLYPENNVTYTYGAPASPFNRAGRIVTVSDASGMKELFYGRLGEVEKEIRTIRYPIIDDEPDEDHDDKDHDRGKYKASEHKDGDDDDHDEDEYHYPNIFVTHYVYDTWGRLQQMTYPDGELLTYGYDSGGLLINAAGVKGVGSYTYIRQLHYDKFGQREFVELGNGATSHYAYDAHTRRLHNLQAKSGVHRFMNLGYGYDLVGNIKTLNNRIGLVPVYDDEEEEHDEEDRPHYAGALTQSFVYDDLYRLTHAQGQYNSRKWEEEEYEVTLPNGEEEERKRWVAVDLKDSYQFDMAYDEIHNIVQKNQMADHYDPSEKPGEQLEQEEDLTYSWMYNYASTHPHAPTRIGKRDFSYDANGNLIRWKERSFHDDEVKQHWRRIVWDEENRVRSIMDGHMEINAHSSDEEKKAYYEYEDEHIQRYIYDDSGERVIKYGHGDDMMVYVNSYYTVRNHEAASKHIFAGNIRMASRLVEYDTEKELDDDHDEHKGELKPDPKHEAVFYYHGDHLGSNHFISDERGRLQEHLEYFPFGELWVEEGDDTTNPLYRFTAKEFDGETDLYYFGARYYDPRTSVWISPDPILGKYLPNAGKQVEFSLKREPHWAYQANLPGMGGVFKSGNLGLYTYTHQNPIKYTDPDGRVPLLLIIPAVGGAINALANAFSEANKPNSNMQSVAREAGIGFAGGAVGTVVGMGVALTGNVPLAGAAGGLAGNLVEQSFSDEPFDAVSATASTLFGAGTGKAADKLLPTVGRLPSLTKPRNASNFGPNSQRIVGQEGISGGLSATTGLVTERLLSPAKDSQATPANDPNKN